MSFNGTVLDAFSPSGDWQSAAFSSLSSHYDSVDWFLKSSLQSAHPQLVFERLYRAMCLRYSAFEIIAIGSFLVQIGLYFAFSVPSFVFQYLPFMQRFKLQPGKYISLADQWFCLKTVGWAKLSIYLPLSVSLYFVLGHLSIHLPYDFESLPPWFHLLPKLYASLLIEDTWHYWAHRFLHHKRLYGLVHKLHHKYNVPFALAAEFAHPVETMALGVGFFIPMLFFFNHLFFFWAWLFVRMLQTTEVHSGYHLPYFNPLQLLPFYGGAQFHDYHHEKFTANYASSFTFWDQLCGTDAGYAARLSGEDGKYKPKAKKM